MSEQLDVLKLVAERLQRADIAYMVSGSIALSYYAQPRLTRDIDIVVALRLEDAERLTDLFAVDFYIDADAVRSLAERNKDKAENRGESSGSEEASETFPDATRTSPEAKVTERFNRSSKNDLSLTMTMDDPRLYSKPVSLGEVNFRWIPSQTFFDFSCVPSSVQMYLKEMADPSGTPPAAK